MGESHNYSLPIFTFQLTAIPMKTLFLYLSLFAINIAALNASNITPSINKSDDLIDMSDFYNGKTITDLKESRLIYTPDLKDFFKAKSNKFDFSNGTNTANAMGCAETDLPESPNCNGVCESGDSSNGPDCNGICDAVEPSSGPDCNGICEAGESVASADCNGVCGASDNSNSVDCNGFCSAGDSSNGPDCNGFCDPGDTSNSPDCNGVCDANDSSSGVDCNGICNSNDSVNGPDCNGICNANDASNGPDCNGVCDTNDSSSSSDCNGICNIGDSANGPDCNGLCNNNDQAGSPDCNGNCEPNDSNGSVDCDGNCDQGDHPFGFDCDGACDIGDSQFGTDCDGFCDFFDHPFGPDCSPILPIVLNDFKVRTQDCNHIIQWETSSEINFLGFEIQQADRNMSFKTIAFVPKSKSTDLKKSYQYTIHETHFDAFYRLKLIDLDDSFTDSSIISMDAACPVELNIYPNPTNGIVNISIDNTDLQSILTINNSIGQPIEKMNLSNHTLSNKIAVDISQHPPGPYYFSIAHQGQYKNLKVIKL